MESTALTLPERASDENNQEGRERIAAEELRQEREATAKARAELAANEAEIAEQHRAIKAEKDANEAADIAERERVEAEKEEKKKAEWRRFAERLELISDRCAGMEWWQLDEVIIAIDELLAKWAGEVDWERRSNEQVNSFAKFRASVAAKDETSAIVGALFDELGITPCNSAKNPKQIKCLAWSMRKAREDFDSFEIVVRLADKLCVDSAISEILLDGLYYIHAYCDKDLNDARLRQRIMKAGAENLVNAAKRAGAFFTRGGAKVWADGMILEINKGLREKFVLAAPEIGRKSS